MQRKELKTDYLYYSFEDFLQDDFFISSVKNPTEESLLFWDNFIENNKKADLQNYNAAKTYIESLPFVKGALSEEEIEDIWKSINFKNSRSEKHRLKRIYISVASVVAGIAAILVAVFYISVRDSGSDSDIYMYANRERPVDTQSAEAQLILSDDKVVVIEDKESEITYEADNVNVKGETISKEEVAVYNELFVPRGKRSMLTFSEGTKVWVNSGTRVVYPAEFDSNKREIYVDGEVYVEVASNEHWPFVVKTKDIGVQVLGTAFNVTAYEAGDMTRVVLASGTVKILPKNKKEEILLSPNNMYEENKEGHNKVVPVNVYNYTSWKDGVYYIQSEGLKDVLERLSVYYGVDILCDEASADLKCSGKLELKKDVYDILVGLSNTAPVKCQYHNGVYKIEYKP